MMKKITAVLMALVLALGLTACGNTATDKRNSDTNAAAQTSDGDTAQSNASPAAGGQIRKALVVYYSASGNTARVAKAIAEAADAELFEIVPVQPYTDADLNWSNSNSRVSREHTDETLRDVPLKTTEVPNWDAYDTVFIGYPIWWGIAAWPVNNFVKGNDFSGKTVIPFATSASSGMGESGTRLAELAGTGNWQNGQRFSSGASEGTVRDWVSGLQ